MKNKTDETYATTDETEQDDEKSLFDKLKYKLGTIFVVVFLASAVIVMFVPNYVIRDDRVTFYITGGPFTPGSLIHVLRGGYTVYFDDIADIELLHYSARQIALRTDGLSLPVLTGGGNSMTNRYSGNFRIIVNVHDTNNRTIWINRHTGTPVLISFTNPQANMVYTEVIYEELITAFESWQVRR